MKFVCSFSEFLIAYRFNRLERQGRESHIPGREYRTAWSKPEKNPESLQDSMPFQFVWFIILAWSFGLFAFQMKESFWPWRWGQCLHHPPTSWKPKGQFTKAQRLQILALSLCPRHKVGTLIWGPSQGNFWENVRIYGDEGGVPFLKAKKKQWRSRKLFGRWRVEFGTFLFWRVTTK